MKKNLLLTGLLASAFAMTLTFTSCEKEEIYAPATGVRNPDPRAVPPAGGTLTVGGSCGYIVSCGSIGIYGPKYNQITFAKNSSTIMYFPTLRYSIYKYTGPVTGGSGYTKIDEFSCSYNTVTYATALLDNATSHYLILTDPSAAAPPSTGILTSSGFSLGTAFAFTTGNLKGGNCGDGDPKF